MKTEFDALKNVSGMFALHVDGRVDPEKRLISIPDLEFLANVTVKELKLVIELAERYAGLCDE